MAKFDFTKDWFGDKSKPIWDHLIPKLNPAKILEIGSFEGAGACYLIETLAKSIDSWQGGDEHRESGIDMAAVEQRFRRNTKAAIEAARNPVNLVVHKESSDSALARLLLDGKRGYFDFIYVDGSHLAPDVLYDCVVAFKLLKLGGVMAFDDYVWRERMSMANDIMRCPKPAVDAFVNIHFNKLQFLTVPLYQLYVTKVAE
jgi:predicted O-methyltransferase YrrM